MTRMPEVNAGRRWEGVTLRDRVWGCWMCEAPARQLPDMSPAIAAGNPNAHVMAVIDHDDTCPCRPIRYGSERPPSPATVAALADLAALREHADADHAALKRVWQLADAYASDPTVPVDHVAVAVTATLRHVAAAIRAAVTGDA